MAIKIFLVYAGVLFACSIVLLTIVKNFAAGFIGSGKKPIIYGSVSSIFASLGVYASTYVTDHLFIVFWIFASLFLLFGIVHVLMTHKKYFSPTPQDSAKTFLGEVFFAMSVVFFTIVVFSSLQYFLNDKSFLFYPMMMSTLAFFIPMLAVRTFDAAYSIPSPAFTTWAFPEKPIELPEDDPREKLLVIGFEIAKKVTDTKKTYFRAKAPENIYLGDLYYFFISDYNEVQSETPIEYCKDQDPCEWLFSLKTKWYQKEKILDPSITVKDNGIRENGVIICERI